jgi:hypothetical protein
MKPHCHLWVEEHFLLSDSGRHESQNPTLAMVPNRISTNIALADFRLKASFADFSCGSFARRLFCDFRIKALAMWSDNIRKFCQLIFGVVACGTCSAAPLISSDGFH